MPSDSPTTSRRSRRLWTIAIGAMLGASFFIPGATVQAPVAEASAAPNGCTSWSSRTRPPNSIRVLRRSSGRVVRVPFRTYVVTVMGKEWPSYLPQAVIEAGAVAVKQYAWYHVLGRSHRSKRGQCYDVTDGVSDQLYKPGKARVRSAHHAAVSKTWNVRLLKHGRLFMTGYRRGSPVRCGRDHTGYKLYARSASKCARQGYSYLQILRRYYGPDLDVINGRGDTSGSASVRSVQASPSPERATNRPAGDARPTADARPAAKPKPAAKPAAKPKPAAALSPAARTLFAEIAAADAPLDLIARRGPLPGTFDVLVLGVVVARVEAAAT